MRDAFYRGDIAREIAAFYALGGLLTYDDLASFHAQIEAPRRVNFHEYDIYTCGPWCQGPALAQVLSLPVDMTCRPSGITPRPAHPADNAGTDLAIPALSRRSNLLTFRCRLPLSECICRRAPTTHSARTKPSPRRRRPACQARQSVLLAPGMA